MDNITGLFQYAFVWRALITGVFVGALCAVLGVFLVLRRLSLIGDGLSHVSFGAIALGLFFGVYPFYVAIPVVLLGALLIQYLSDKARVYGDAAIGIVSALGLAAGVVLAGVSRGFNADLYSYLFGNILAISNPEMIQSIVLSLVVLSLIVLFFNELFATAFSEDFANIAGIKVSLINTMLVCVTAISVVLSVRVVGVLLISAFLIFPAVTALQLAHGFKGVLLVSVILSIIAVIAGIFISFVTDLPTGATIVLVNFLFLALSMILRKVHVF